MFFFLLFWEVTLANYFYFSLLHGNFFVRNNLRREPSAKCRFFDQATLAKVEKVGTKVGVSWLKKRMTRVNQVKG